jgi:para-nitrobenzyl esterase
MRIVFLVYFISVVSMNSQAQAKKVNPSSTRLVKIASGTLEGSVDPAGIVSFKGIPFSAPPVGTLRWKAPQPVKPWKGVRKADKFGPRAMQAPIFSDMVFRSNGVSEDCLYLNVWAPAKKGTKGLPVLVYFYGGGFVAGDGSEPRYDGANMAQKGIITLTVNYRLGAFGFLSHPELTKESPHKASGNYGLLDQAAALMWVQKNIAAFGGDPKRVTIAGESAGSISVSALMASPLSKNIIAGAIGESGSVLGALPAVPLEDGERTGVDFAKTLGATSLAALRSLPADSILNGAMRFGAFRFARTIDGYFFPEDPFVIYEKGRQAKVPLLVGWNNQEMDHRAILGTSASTKEAYEAAVRRLYGDQADEVLRLYHVQSDADVEGVATELAGDRFISYSTWKWADMHARSGYTVYRYLYEHPRPVTVKDKGKLDAYTSKGAVHSAEIEYALGNLSTNKVFAWTEEDYKVSRIMQDYFSGFIKAGNPNSTGLVNWPSATGSTPAPVLHIGVVTAVKGEEHRDRYLLLDRISRNK